jgi:hypothetical protein
MWPVRPCQRYVPPCSSAKHSTCGPGMWRMHTFLIRATKNQPLTGKIPGLRNCNFRHQPAFPSTNPAHLGPRQTDKMATELTVQSERAFQKQPHSELFLGAAALSGSRGGNRIRLSIGAGADDVHHILVFLNSKTKVKSARPGKGGRRWYKDVGLGFRTPKTAIEGQYIGMLPKHKRAPQPNDSLRSPAKESIFRRRLELLQDEWVALGQGTTVNWWFSLQTRSAPSRAWFRSAAVS